MEENCRVPPSRSRGKTKRTIASLFSSIFASDNSRSNHLFLNQNLMLLPREEWIFAVEKKFRRKRALFWAPVRRCEEEARKRKSFRWDCIYLEQNSSTWRCSDGSTYDACVSSMRIEGCLSFWKKEDFSRFLMYIFPLQFLGHFLYIYIFSRYFWDIIKIWKEYVSYMKLTCWKVVKKYWISSFCSFSYILPFQFLETFFVIYIPRYCQDVSFEREHRSL